MAQLQQFLPQDSLQYILSQKIGFGNAQKKLSRPLQLLLLSGGAESVVIGLILPHLTQQWDIQTQQKTLLITTISIGLVIGSFLQTYSDKYGRHKLITYDTILISVFGLLSCLCTGFTSFLIVRFFYGMGIGILLPLSGAYLAEVTPDDQRSNLLSRSRVFLSFGSFCACVVGWILRYNNWRIVLFIITLPSLFALYLHLKEGKQSIRYLWVIKQKKEIYQVLKYMAQENGKQRIITQQQINRVLAKVADQDKQQKSQLKGLFLPKYRTQTIYLCITWFTICFVFYAVLILFPTIIDRNKRLNIVFQFTFVATITAFETFASWFSRFIMNSQLFGRKKSIYLQLLIVAIANIFIIFIGEDHPMILLTLFIIIKVFVTFAFMTIYLYTAEIYQTLLRGNALGFHSCVGRCGAILIGVSGVNSLNWMNGFGLYYLSLLLALVSSYFIYKMPYDTLDRSLDLVVKDQK